MELFQPNNRVSHGGSCRKFDHLHHFDHLLSLRHRRPQMEGRRRKYKQGLTDEKEMMNRAQLKQIWNRSQPHQKFHRLLLATLSALVRVPSKLRDQLAARALADFTLRKAGPAGRRDLRRRLKPWVSDRA
jgi:hypothetical protein